MQDWQMDWQNEEPEDDGQLELPGIALDRSDELLESLGELEERLERMQLTAEAVSYTHLTLPTNREV